MRRASVFRRMRTFGFVSLLRSSTPIAVTEPAIRRTQNTPAKVRNVPRKYRGALTSPSSPLGNKTTTNRANNRTKEGSSTVNRHGHTSLLTTEQVGNDATSNGQTARPPNTGQEAEDNEATQARSESTANLPDAEKGIGNS